MYACLPQNEFYIGEYALVAIRPSDIFLIKEWRNAQIDILRQAQPLTDSDQRHYFETIIYPSFAQVQPKQLLFSFLHRGNCIGYGGLVHISWQDRNAEISFLLETERNKDIALFRQEWAIYLQLLQKVAFDCLNFEKIYTYAYDIRPYLIETLEKMGFEQEARLRRHVFIKGQAVDVLIHALFKPIVKLRRATENDILTVFNWANDPLVRQMSFNSSLISMEEHSKWYKQFLSANDKYLLIAEVEQHGHWVACGQVRIDSTGEIGILIAPSCRGMKLSNPCLKAAINYIKQQNPPYQYIVAHIRLDNTASIKSFESAGFVKHGLSVMKNIDCYKYLYKLH
jgi:RimJ/RimL family protein N-acetyltransferase